MDYSVLSDSLLLWHQCCSPPSTRNVAATHHFSKVRCPGACLQDHCLHCRNRTGNFQFPRNSTNLTWVGTPQKGWLLRSISRFSLATAAHIGAAIISHIFDNHLLFFCFLERLHMSTDHYNKIWSYDKGLFKKLRKQRKQSDKLSFKDWVRRCRKHDFWVKF